MQQRDPVQWVVRIYLHRLYFTAEILAFFTPLKAFLLFFPIQIEEDHLPTPISPALLSEPLPSSTCNKLYYSFPPLRGMALKNFDLCEHSMGLFHSSKWPMNTRLESRYCHYTVFVLRKEKLCLLGQQQSKLGMWLSKHYELSPIGQHAQGKSTSPFKTDTSLIMNRSSLQ